MNFTLQQIRVFAAICRLGSVSRAAQALAMSQSAASTALAELERRSGARLFDRAGKRLHLNEVGRTLLPSVLEMVDRAAELDQRFAGRGGPGPLTVGATMTIGNYLIPGLVEHYWQRHPAASLSIKVGNTRDIVERVAAFDLDLALIEGECDDPELEALDWLDDELAVFCAPSHPLGKVSSVDVGRLLDEDWVVRERGSGTRQTLDRAMAPWRDRWRIALELEQIEAMLRIVAIGRLIGCASRLALRDDLTSGRLMEIRVPDLVLRRSLAIVVHRRKYRTRALQAFVDVCRDAARGSRRSHEVEVGYMRGRLLDSDR